MADLDLADPENVKLLTLARGAMSRVRAPQGAALRDETGRTYSSASVSLPSRSFSAVSLVVAQAAASGARGIEAVVVVGEPAAAEDVVLIRDLGGFVARIAQCEADGTPRPASAP
ncbi:MAG: cytidine deaminase [Actinomycetes bacterium]